MTVRRRAIVATALFCAAVFLPRLVERLSRDAPGVFSIYRRGIGAKR